MSLSDLSGLSGITAGIQTIVMSIPEGATFWNIIAATQNNNVFYILAFSAMLWIVN